MKLIKFRVTEYKSIKDSGYCWLASDVTTLAGKNESGKSGILEALRDFDTNIEKISDEALPLDQSGEPMIELVFDADKATLDAIAQEKSITIDKATREHIAKNGVAIFKYFDGSYDLSDEALEKLLDKSVSDKNAQIITKIKTSLDKLKKIDGLTDLVDPKISGSIEEIKNALTQFVAQATAKAAAITETEKKSQADSIIATITAENGTLQSPTASDVFLEEIQAYIPNFIFFSDFLDILPFELPLAEAKNNKPVSDFAKVAGLSLDDVVKTTNTQLRRNLLSKHSASITGDFMGYWGQNQLDLVAEADGDKLRLGVREAGKTMLFKPEQRSKGFQWFLSFYLRLNAEKDETNIILIDEPGLYLHAKAQKDVLKVFEEIAKESQVIFSTHSPYLIDAQRLDRVRLVIKDDANGTKVENKIHKNADNETLTPIITAIGLDLTQDFSIAGKHNVLLEGISDYYFLQALKEFMTKGKTTNANLIPCVGAPKAPQIASLLLGWDLEFLAVLDNDAEGKRIAKELAEKLAVPENKIIPVSDQDGNSIEDLFTHDDFNNFVLDDGKSKDKAVANSKFLKDQKIDKVLLSKKFFEKVKTDKSKITLSQDTIKNFEVIFDKIATGFSNS
ncbi:MAG: AAA family ATPase [Candidatus Paceibacterota bacterium]|nr:MAG: AAA family ATPase [Candidatus Paceibacterota bacterium]